MTSEGGVTWEVAGDGGRAICDGVSGEQPDPGPPNPLTGGG